VRSAESVFEKCGARTQCRSIWRKTGREISPRDEEGIEQATRALGDGFSKGARKFQAANPARKCVGPMAISDSLVLGLVALAAAIVFPSSQQGELGHWGFFMVWVTILSVFYLANFVLITIVLYSVFRRRLRSLRVWSRSTIGTLFFAATVPLWSLTGGRLQASEVAWHSAVALVVGFACFVVLGWYEDKYEQA